MTHKQAIYIFFIILELIATQQMAAVETSEDNFSYLDRQSWHLPDFSNSNRGKNTLLADSEPWIPSRTDQLTFLSPSQPLRVELRLNKNAQQSAIESCDLLYKCSPGDTTEQTLNLIAKDPNHQWKVSNHLCTSQLGFVVERQNATSYRINILPESKVPFNQSLQHYMEFSIRIRYKEGMLNSAKLYTFSLISLFNINSEKRSRTPSSSRRFFLTWQAVDLLMGRISDLNLKLDKPVVKINFLEKDLLDVIKKAPNIIGALLTVTVSLKVSYSPTKYKRYLISSGEGVRRNKQSDANRNNNSDYIRHGLSLSTGHLLIDRSFLTTTLKEWDEAIVDVTLSVSINGLRNNSHVKKNVVNYNAMFGSLSLPSIPDAGKQLECESIDTSNVSVIPHYTGMQDVLLTSPVVCPKSISDTKNRQDYNASVTYDCGQNCPIGQSRRVSRLEGNCKIKIQGPLGKRDLGKYKFTTRGMPSHTYKLVEADLPIIAALPDAIITNKFAILELECSAPLPAENYKFVHMSVHFRVMNARRATGDRWHDITLDQFATRWLQIAPKKIRRIKLKNRSKEFGYKLYLPISNLADKWQINFICRAKIDGPEVKSTLGIPQYEFEVGTPIRYYRFDEAVEMTEINNAGSLVSQNRAINAACLVVAYYFYFKSVSLSL